MPDFFQTSCSGASTHRLAGVVLPVGDLGATKDFYGEILPERGRWSEGERSLSFTGGGQALSFIEESRPRFSPESGAHIALRVVPGRTTKIAETLSAAGFEVSTWREDHPRERAASTYVKDPTGHTVQLVAAEDSALFLDHAAVEVHDLVLAEAYYSRGLGAVAEYAHGTSMDDYAEAKAWGEGRDPCAPWTRLFVVRVSDRQRMARPNLQLFFRLGETRLGLIVAREHRQEPPEELIRGTPRAILETKVKAEDMVEHLRRLRIKEITPGPLPFAREGNRIYLRDPAGNFLELHCAEN